LIAITTFIFISVSNFTNAWAYDTEGNKKSSVYDDATSCESQEERWERIKKERSSKPSSNTDKTNSSEANTADAGSEKNMAWHAPTDKKEIEKVCYKINIRATIW